MIYIAIKEIYPIYNGTKFVYMPHIYHNFQSKGMLKQGFVTCMMDQSVILDSPPFQSGKLSSQIKYCTLITINND